MQIPSSILARIAAGTGAVAAAALLAVPSQSTPGSQAAITPGAASTTMCGVYSVDTAPEPTPKPAPTPRASCEACGRG